MTWRFDFFYGLIITIVGTFFFCRYGPHDMSTWAAIGMSFMGAGPVFVLWSLDQRKREESR